MALNRKSPVYLQIQLSCTNIKILEHRSHQASFQYCTCMKNKCKYNSIINDAAADYRMTYQTSSNDCLLLKTQYEIMLPVVRDVHDGYTWNLPDSSL